MMKIRNPLEEVDRLLLGEGPAEPEPVTAAELAEWLGLSANRVGALARQGILPRAEDSRYPLRPSILAYCRWVREAAESRRGGEALAAEKLRVARESADKLAIQNARAKGELIRADDVARAWGEVVTDLRAAILAVPARVAGRAGLDRAAAAALDDEIRTALEAIADDR